MSELIARPFKGLFVMSGSLFTIQLKRLGKKKIHTVQVSFKHQLKTLRELINCCVDSEVNRFSQKQSNHLQSIFSSDVIASKAEQGQVDFGQLKNEQLAILDQAKETAIQGFIDGIYVVFIDDTEIKTLEEPISIDASTSIAFIRLTFLTGPHW